MYGKSNMETYITICKTANGNLLYGSGNSNKAVYLPGRVRWGREVQKGGDICIPTTDSCCRLIENNKIL